jgi:hypothetical protein
MYKILSITFIFLFTFSLGFSQRSYDEMYLFQGGKTEYGSKFGMRFVEPIGESMVFDLCFNTGDESTYCAYSISYKNYESFKRTHIAAYSKYKEWSTVAVSQKVKEYYKVISEFNYIEKGRGGDFAMIGSAKFRFIFKVIDSVPYFCYVVNLSSKDYSKYAFSEIIFTDNEASGFTEYLDYALKKQKEYTMKNNEIDDLFK